MSRLHLLQDRVVIIQDEADWAVGYIIIPDDCRQKPSRGTVLHVGPGMRTKKGGVFPMPEELVPGARVTYHPYAGEHRKLDGEDVIVVRDSDCLAVDVDDEGNVVIDAAVAARGVREEFRPREIVEAAE
jgi:chaperonin GroES